MPTTPTVLVLGAKGFIGSNLTHFLLRRGVKVRAFDIQWDFSSWRLQINTGLLEIVEGSIFDKNALSAALEGVSTVFNCISFSVPGTSPGSFLNELSTTVPAMELLLSAMVKMKTARLFFFSSGGTVYGDTGQRPARETDPVQPSCSYALGKVVCEEMIRFYARINPLQYRILRVSNVYGAVSVQRHSQGVVDVFVESILRNKPLTVWGRPDNLRDYIFIDDVMDAVGALMDQEDSQFRIINVGTGIGSSVLDVIRAIERIRGCDLKWQTDPTRYAGVSHNILDISLLRKLTGWQPAYSLARGITELFRRHLEANETSKTSGSPGQGPAVRPQEDKI
jgi:UDP-glucose 4-epimerase